jgi:5-methylthioadenosine/S-adenosylhomocysteine deaminase
LPASRALRLATIDGAHALGLDSEIGSLEVGKRADVAVVRLERLHTTPVKDVVSALVYSTEADDVDTVIIDGRIVMRDRELLTIDEGETIANAKSEAEKLIAAAV